jgi:hypothetical protein
MVERYQEGLRIEGLAHKLALLVDRNIHDELVVLLPPLLLVIEFHKFNTGSILN